MLTRLLAIEGDTDENYFYNELKSLEIDSHEVEELLTTLTTLVDHYGFDRAEAMQNALLNLSNDSAISKIAKNDKNDSLQAVIA